MGFTESLGKFMSKLFSGQTKKWEENLTIEMIDDLERQGCDVTELRQKYNDREAAEQERKRKLTENSINMMDLSKLDAYKAVPRDANSEFILDSAKLNSAGNKKKEKIMNARIVYAAVVQAYYALWEPGYSEPAGIVFVFALDEKHMYDQEWLRQTAKRISEMKDGGAVPADCQKFINTLRDDQSYFCFKLGDSLSDGADAWCATYTLSKSSNLPGGYLPASRIMPLFLLENPKENQFASFELIPAKYYTKL